MNSSILSPSLFLNVMQRVSSCLPTPPDSLSVPIPGSSRAHHHMMRNIPEEQSFNNTTAEMYHGTLVVKTDTSGKPNEFNVDC